MKHHTRKLLSLVLALCMLLSLAAPAAAAPAGRVTFTKVDNSAVSAGLLTKADELHTMTDYVDTDMVRVSIFLDEQSTIMAGYSADSIADNSAAMAYRAGLKDRQAQITAAIERKLGAELDVVWNLTLAANLISANVEYGQIEAIESVDGVSQVLIETRYEPDVVKSEEINDPSMSTSSAQIGSPAAWAAGYTGAGSRIAVIDTGADTDHQSLNPDAFQYSLAYAAGKSGMSMEEYAEYIDLLDAEEIAALADDLNAPVGSEAYINAKIPFGYNYIDGDLDVTHDNDSQGSHGSHVSGIAAANSFLYTDEGFVSALDSAMVQGVAPDAQLIAMKVFGKAGGAYDSDYMAAIEDAIVLGCDSCNLSLGSGNPGTSRNATAEYQAIMESLTESGIVAVMSAGNSGSWVENAYNAGYLYAEDVSMQTNGQPGSFTNSLSVASVDNDGSTGYFITVGDMMIVYNEMLEGSTGAYTNEPFTTIAGEHEYVLIEGVGTPEDFAVVGDALTGKIALCSRGETSFFEKATAAVDAGAIATFIYNNQSGVINMDLSDYEYTNPCASLTLADGLAIKAASTPVTDDEGNVLYYTGTMTVSDSLGAGQFNSEFYTMSSFSSWGVPGSLELKPEITAPGGSIYSINGVDPSGSAYEVMSGTSMAAPQVSGMVAVVAQYLRENGLVEQTGLTERQLAQSLLMSTAEPMLADASGYYSVLQQGAGLANVGAAVTADSYITMADGMSAGAADGKVKVELGDDPERTGEYTATFTINNLTWEEKAFDLGADFFIQAPTSDGVNMYMYTATALIGADVTWTVNGETVEPASMAGLDFNGDGLVNSDDGMAILNYATGIEESLTNMDKADLDADGDVDSYDAYLFLAALNSGVAMLPAFGSAEVTVTIKLSQDWKDTLDYYYPNGTYIQGYIYAQSLTDAEGVAGTCHSIPVLGFFGNWTDASMFDVGSYQVYATGEESRMPYLGDPEGNTYLVTYANEPGAKYIFGGNPLVPDSVYMPERNAINSADMISGISFIAIRNAAASRLTAVNETTGEILAEAMPGAVDSAYYYVNGGYWNNTGYTLNAQVPVSDASEGDIISMGLTLAPEYYVDAEGNVDWDALGTGATFGTTMVVDNTAPELKDVSLSFFSNNLTVTASDNEYISAVALYNKAGTQVLAFEGAKQDIAKGETAEYVMSMDGLNGSKFLLQVTDYAMNTTTYLLEMQLGDEPELPGMIAFDLDNGYWTTFTKDSTYEELEQYSDTDLTFYAATIVDHIVFASTDSGDLYVMPETDLTDMTFVTNLGTVLADMAYNKADGNIYAVNGNGELVTVDKLTGAVEVVGEIGVLTNTLACDANGTFYCNGYGTGAVYSFTLDTIAEPEVLIEDVGIATQFVQTMECDPNSGMLCWNSYYVFSFMGYNFGIAYYYEIDPATGEFTQYEDLWYEMTCLIIPEKTSGGSWSAPTDVVSGISVAPAELGMIKGGSAKLTASVLPWTATDRTVTWTSSDESVAAVDANGNVTAVGVGTATITATSNLDPSFTAESLVTVETLNYTISGVLQDAEGNPTFFDWNMETDDTWTAGTAMDTSIAAATYDALSGYLYVQDGTDSAIMHKVDTATGETVAYGPACAFGAAMFDLTAMEIFATAEAPAAMGIYNAYILSPSDPMLNTFSQGWNLASYLSQYTGGTKFVAITSMGEYVEEGVTNELIFALDDAGYVWALFYDGTSSIGFDFIPTDLALEYPMNGNNQFCSLIDANDGSLFLSYFTGDTNEIYHLTPTDDGSTFTSARVGDVGADVWPASLLSATTNAAAEANWSIAPRMTAEAAPVVREEPVSITAAAGLSNEGKAQLMAAEGAVAEDETTVTVDIVADEDATNGVFEITWDPEVLELAESFEVAPFASSIEDESSITYGFVSLAPIAAGDTILSLTFNVKKTEDTIVTVNQKQLNNTTGTAEDILVEFEHANTEVRDAIAATCTTAGYTGDTYCTDCGKLVAKGTIIEALGHSYEAVVTEPTCTSDGYTTYTCTVCGDSYIADYVSSDCACNVFVDVGADQWFHDAIDYVVDNGLMNGLSSTIFAPGATLNRAQIVTVLYRLAGSPEVEVTTSFVDVPADSYCAAPVAWALENGITTGISDTMFNATGSVDRAQLVTFLYRYAQSAGMDVTTTGDLSAYTDAADVPEWAVDAFTWAVENGIVNGMTADTLVPAATANRAQIAMILMRFAQ